jgi:flagellar hook-basal body protein
MQSLYTASTGMLGMQTQIDTTANNIANVNTIGFKKSRAEFADLMYHVMEYAGTSTSDTTKSPTGIEVGLGVRPTAINKIFSEGSLKQTDNQLDIAITGRGFFKMELPDGTEVYSKNGAFKVDENGKIHQVIIDGKKPIETDFVILSVGIKPNTELLVKQGAKHIKNGALIVNEKMETSIQDVYAAGDNVAIKNLQTNEYGYFPLGTHSNKAGRAAGANAVGSETIFKGAYHTAIVQVFNYTFARTGLNSTYLKEQNINFKTVLSIVGATPGYYPDKKEIVSEIYFDAKTEEIYGAELVGEVGVDKRIDVLSTAIYAKLKISDLAQLDLAYAPPYSPAKDSVVVSSFISENIKTEECPQISVDDLDTFIEETPKDNYLLIDTRTQEEYEEGTLPNAINIPIDEVRSQIDFIKKESKPVILICRSGLRAYIVQLILVHNNIPEVTNVGGGIKLWKLCNKPVTKPKEMFV